MVAALLAVVIALAIFSISALKNDVGASATPCEQDCINDSGGKAWCSEYCKKNGTYGPAKK